MIAEMSNQTVILDLRSPIVYNKKGNDLKQ